MTTAVLDLLVVLSALGGLVLLIPALTLLCQVLSAGWRRSGVEAAPSSMQVVVPRVTVLIPAHDEESGLQATLDNVKAALGPDDQILVVADNCTDGTAALARRAGAQVTERRNPNLRGKGYALDHGVRHVATSGYPPDVLIVVDADCTVAPDALRLLGQVAQRHVRPVQASYLMHAPMGAGIKVRVAAFAWLVKNHVRPLGQAVLGLPCQLTGSGMAFPWHLIAQAPLANGHRVEDMKLGVDLALAGYPPTFCVEAHVHSQFPTHVAGLESQRRRWEQGHLSVIAHLGLPLVGRALRRVDVPLLGMALDLCVPPLASLVLLNGLVLLLGIAVALVSGQWLGAALPLAAFGLLFFAVVLAWSRWGRDVVSASDLLAVPAYVVGKLPIYLASVLGRSEGWVRTRRDEEPTNTTSTVGARVPGGAEEATVTHPDR